MLLVKRENQIIEQFTAGHRAVVAENRVQKPRAVLELAVSPQHKAHRDRLIKRLASVAHNAVHQLHAFPDLTRFLLA